MPSSSSFAADRRARIERLDRLSRQLDSRFVVPGTGFRVGWDSILGLIPGVGDVVTAIPGGVMIYEGVRMGARRRALVRMGANTGIDMLVGGIPVVGDVFDAAFKSHRKNIAILKEELERIEAREGGTQSWLNESDRTTDTGRRRTSSDPRETSRTRVGTADGSNARSGAGTN